MYICSDIYECICPVQSNAAVSYAPLQMSDLLGEDV